MSGRNLFPATLALAIAIALALSTAPCAAAPAGPTYDDVRTLYAAAGDSWARAWSASEVGEIRQNLAGARGAYAACLEAAAAVDDPENAANLALIRSISAAYVDLADAALAMYAGADTYAEGRVLMDEGDYAAAAARFGEAAGVFESSSTLFERARSTLLAASYSGTAFGDGTDYTALIVPILEAKGAYMDEFATCARGWQHSALAYGAVTAGDRDAVVREAGTAMDLFAALLSSEAFGADAAANRAILAGLIGGDTAAPTPSPTATATPSPTATATPPPAVTVELVADSSNPESGFSPSTLTVPAGARVTLVFDNRDWTTHSVSIFADEDWDDPIFEGAPVKGPAVVEYTFTAPAAPGRYVIACGVPSPHRMGTLVVE
ncbi:MAG: hypothetical protein GXY82_08705 [Methanospirillum sp.]|nr:hypothetical protein [Methanospirillum sp.]